MGENTEIEWADHSWNPWIGCTKVSAGCKNCYAEMLMDKRYGKVQWGPHGTRVRTSGANWKKPLAWNRRAEKEGLRYRVFCASLADVFEDLPGLVEWRADLLALIFNTPNLDWLLLTKRPENIMQQVEEAGENLLKSASYAAAKSWLTWAKHGEAYAPNNVWFGTSVEDQDAADKRIPTLLRIPAKVRFLSMEPLLGPVDLTIYREIEGFEVALDTLRGVESIDGQAHLPVGRIAWVIVGGESGAHARPMDAEWAQTIQRQCAGAGTRFFMKQMGGWPDKRHALSDFPEDLRVREFPGGYDAQ